MPAFSARKQLAITLDFDLLLPLPNAALEQLVVAKLQPLIDQLYNDPTKLPKGVLGFGECKIGVRDR